MAIGSTLRGGLLAGLAGLLLFGALYAANPLLHDTDSAYHLQIARRYAGGDFSDQLSWTRRSLLSESFGDKELLFHLLLVPFARGADPMAGGRVFLALLDALVLATVGALATRSIGRWGWLLPIGLVLGSVEFDWRLVRLRPELLSLILLLLAAAAAAARRPRLLGALAFVYALSYIAWHALLGLCVIWFLLYGLLRREWDPMLVLYPALGVGAGLLVHPQFPANLAVGWAVHVDFFRFKSALDVGTEIRPNTTDVLLFANLGIWLGLLALWRSRTAAASAEGGELAQLSRQRAPIAYGAAAALFGVLYLLMSRFSIYFLPMAALTLLATIAARGERIGSRIPLAAGRSLPLFAALAAIVVASLPLLAREIASYRDKTAPGPNRERIADREAFGRAVPAGAKVAAPWGASSLYMLYAPQGRYLNVLDPVLMAAHDPRSYQVQRAIFEGLEPDLPLALVRDLDSDYLALPAAGAAPTLLARLAADPRMAERYRGFHVLYEVRPGTNSTFWLDWQRVPLRAGAAGAGLPPESPRYPVLPAEAGGRLEGFVDLTRVDSTACERLVRRWEEPVARTLDLEFAPYGPGSITLDGAESIATQHSLAAVLGEGLRFRRPIAPGLHVVSVETCVDPTTRRQGFFLRELDQP